MSCEKDSMSIHDKAFVVDTHNDVLLRSMIGDDIFLEGVKRVNYFDELPDKSKQNNAYLSITTNDENKSYYKGKRIYVGKNVCDKTIMNHTSGFYNLVSKFI